MLKKLFPVIVVVIILGSFFLIKSNTTSTPQKFNSNSIRPSVEVVDNLSANRVIIPQVNLDNPGFVMIHRSVNGKAGEIIMTGEYLGSGIHRDVVVNTGINTVSGESYFAMLHVDNGNKYYDNPGVDPPLVIDNEIIQEEFNIVDSITGSFEIIINGINRQFNKSKYHNLSPNVYINAINPNQVVITQAEATWGDFFDSLPFKVTNDCITTGTGERYCDGEGGKIVFLINGIETKGALATEIGSGDKLTVIFE
jgi:hypothetical protein